MTVCPKCAAENAKSSRFCSECGSALTPEIPTTTPPGTGAELATGDAELADGESSRHGRYLPGTKVAGRYRIVSLIGKGGMGEVYRADDLELGQTVALKFLPRRLTDDPQRLRYFRSEVRLSRQISHPNVCRVYDIGEVDGQHFLSMEYIDGEDLSIVLRRLGRPSSEKAIELARQLCLGLAAAHENEVVHRDLKPANIMIDGRGRVRITDFGLATCLDNTQHDTLRAGTPAYMAPEQLAEGVVSVRSDLYSLGLVLHELFTGKRVFDTNDIPALKRLHSTGPCTPSSLTEDIDPVVEQVIMHCLEQDRHQRPQSAYQVLAALPGGDPLATALAAGETPSPEMVASAGAVGVLSPPIAIGLLAAFIGFALLTIWSTDRGNLLNQLKMDKPPAVLRDRALTILDGFGYDKAPGYVASWFAVDHEVVGVFVEELNRSDQALAFEDRQPPLVQFDFRTSREQMVRLGWSGRVRWTRPPFDQPGMVRLTLDAQGNLIRFAAIASTDQITSNHGTTELIPFEDFDWTPVLHAAGLDDSALTPIEPIFVPPVHCDYLAAWRCHWPGAPDLTMDVHAGVTQDRLSYFHFQQTGTPHVMTTRNTESGVYMYVLMVLVVVVIGLLFVLRNLREGRGDRKGAFRLALFVFGISMARWVFTANHVGLAEETELLLRAFSFSCGLAVITWAMYLAVEPYARRYMHETLISWARLLSGRFRDPRVGRDLLLGVLIGAGMYCILSTFRVVFAGPDFHFPNFDVDVLAGGPFVLGVLCIIVLNALMFGCGHLVLLLVLRVLLRRTVIAGAAFVLLIATAHALEFGPSLPTIFISVMIGIGFSFVVIRYGLLAAIAEIAAWEGLERFSATFDFGQWYAGQLLVGPLFVFALALYGFWISLAGQPIIGDILNDRTKPRVRLDH